MNSISRAHTGVLDQLMDCSRIQPDDETYDLARTGIEHFLSRVLQDPQRSQRVEKLLVDQVIAEIDQRIGHQLDAIVHHPAFQALESAWRGLYFLVQRTDFRENIRIAVMDVPKTILEQDFVDNPDLTTSGLYKHVYSSEYGQFGGSPVAALVGNFHFGPGQRDVDLLAKVADVAAVAHAPFIAAADSSFFGLEDYTHFHEIKDLDAVLEGPRYARWHSFRDRDNARYVGLTLPGFLLRSPYGADGVQTRGFHYQEQAADRHQHYLWGNAAFAFAANLCRSFAAFRWCPNIVGPRNGGAVDDLPQHFYPSAGSLQMTIPVETLISDRKEYELAEAGFIALTMRKGADNAAFFSANSVQRPRRFPDTDEGRRLQADFRLGTQLPYLFIITRIAHYIKVLQREQIGSWKSRAELEKELNLWLRQYISDQENPPPLVRSRRPLRAAMLQVSDSAADPGSYDIDLSIVPHFKYMGANFTLSLQGRLEKT